MTQNTRYFNAAIINDGTPVRVFLELDGTGRYVWSDGRGETYCWIYETKTEARQDIRSDERFIRAEEQ